MEVFKDESREEAKSPSDVGIIWLIRPDGKLIVESPGDAMVIEQRLSDLSHLDRCPCEFHRNGMFVNDPVHDRFVSSSSESLVDAEPVRIGGDGPLSICKRSIRSPQRHLHAICMNDAPFSILEDDEQLNLIQSGEWREIH